jgi:CRISPR-associated protein Csd1
MSWLTELNAVYDTIIRDRKIEDKPLPLYHTSNNASLVISLGGNGKFISARLLGKDEQFDRQTCMPCTEKSSSRTRNVEAYPLCDKLEYIAGDYAQYMKGIRGKNLEEKHNAYMSCLGGWAQSAYSNQKIQSIYRYVKKGNVINDILKAKLPEMDSAVKIAGYGDFVRWEVNIPGATGGKKTWEDPEIQRLWIKYYTHTCPNSSGFCYVSGKKSVILGELHGQKIRNAGDGAKLISSNDATNYTFRGRFTRPDQACQIGMEVSVKAHSALRWLIRNQGDTIGDGLTVVSWTPVAAIRPLLIKRTITHDENDNDDGDNELHFSSESYARAINNRLRGYYDKLAEKDKVIIMGLNAATPGRMSIILYREFIKSDFFEAQEHWYYHLAWFYSYWEKEEEDKKSVHKRTISAPAPTEIVTAAYGKKASEKITAAAIQRLLPCIIDKGPIPYDIEQLCFERASAPKTLDNNEKEKTLETACAVIRYNIFMRNGEDYNVGLDENIVNRDYLYGRLLAVADRVEARVLYKRGERRETNAARYMQRFSRYPCSTWEFLYVDKLRPYFSQLPQKSRDWYNALIQEIKWKFDRDEFTSEKALAGEFLLGYHCQQKALWEGIAKSQAKQLPEPTDEEDD